MANSQQLLTDMTSQRSPQDKPVRKKPTFEVITGSLDSEQKSAAQPATSISQILAYWPWAWFAFAGFVNIAWAVALGWAAFAFVQWLV